MPSVSEKQHRAMEAAAHGHSALGIPKSVGEEFVSHDWSESQHPRGQSGKFGAGSGARKSEGEQYVSPASREYARQEEQALYDDIADDELTPEQLRGLTRDALDAERRKAIPGSRYDQAVLREIMSREALGSDQAHEPDSVGRIHLARVPISKANVCPYRGAEIPKWQELGLNPDKVYQLLRDPQELQKAAATFNGIQVLHRHTPVSAMDHRPGDIVGSTGTHAQFVDPYLYNSLSLWARQAIAGVEDKSKRELSSSYEYDADMRPGVYQGAHYDGVMRNLRGNHVAIVTKGRAGPDVAIDEAPPDLEPPLKEKIMSKTAVPSRTAIRLQAAFSALAMDERLDLTEALKGVTAKNLKSRKPEIFKAVRLAFDAVPPDPTPSGAPATDPAAPAQAAGGATPDDVILKVLEMVEGQTANAPPAEAEADEAAPVSTDPNGAAAAPAALDPKIVAWLKAKGMGDDDVAELGGLMGGGDVDPPSPDPVDPDPKDPTPKAKDEEDEPMVSKAAMDQAIAVVQQRVLKTQREIAQAADYVRPWVGSLAMDESIESASDVYRKALGSLGIPNAGGLHADALKPILDAQPKASIRGRTDAVVAMDAASDKSLSERFPHFAHITGAA